MSDFEPKGNHPINNFNGDFVHVTCDNTCSKMVITTQQQGGSTTVIICWIGLQMVIVSRVHRGCYMCGVCIFFLTDDMYKLFNIIVYPYFFNTSLT